MTRKATSSKPKHTPAKKDAVILAFASAKLWRAWLQKNHTVTPEGLWIRFYKKNSGVATVTYAEALDEALCYGWIDSQVKKYDEQSYIQKFTPRRARSLWSKRNIEHITRLEQLGRMRAAGQAEVVRAKADGRWGQAYSSPSTMTMPVDFLARLAKNKKAETFFKTLNKTNLYAIAWRLETAKRPETRERRMTAIVAMLEKGEKFH